jgi:hypothetical protein
VELYISSPYFTPTEASLIKSTIVEVEDVTTYVDLEAMDAQPVSMVIEEAIKPRPANFFE